MNDENQKEKDVIYLDKVGLLQNSTEKINAWISAVEEKKQGTKITKRALVNWIIAQMPDQPSKSDLNLLIEMFYDEERHLKQRIRQLRERKYVKTDDQNTSEATDTST